MKCLLLVWLLAGLLLAACAPRQYAGRTPDAPVLATHRTVAVLPFEVSLYRLRLRDIRCGGTDTSAATQQRMAGALPSRRPAARGQSPSLPVATSSNQLQPVATSCNGCYWSS